MSFFPSNRRSIVSALGLTAVIGCGEVRIDPFETTASTGNGQGAEGGGGGQDNPTGGGDGGGGYNGPGPTPIHDQRPMLVLAQAGGVSLWGNADQIGSDVLPSKALVGVSNPRKLALHGENVWVYTQGDTSIAKALMFQKVGYYDDGDAAAEVTIDVPTESGATNIHDFRLDAAGRIFVEHVPLAQPFVPETMMFMHWEGSDGEWFRDDFLPYWTTYAFSSDESTIFAGTSQGIMRVAVDREAGTMVEGPTRIMESPPYPVLAMYEGDLIAVTSCEDGPQGPQCYQPHLRIWRDVGDGSTIGAPDVDIDLGVSLAPCALDVNETGTFIAMCSGLAGPIAAPPRLLRLASPSALDSSSTPFGDIQLPNEPRELAVIPAEPQIDDAPFSVFVRCDDRLIIARDHMGTMVLDVEMVNGISTTYDMILINKE